MRYFLDTEFSERGPRYPIELISIGVVAEDGREFYACNADFSVRHANDWVKENVLPLLPEKRPTPPPWGSPRIWMESEAWMPFAAIGPAFSRFLFQTRFDAHDDAAPEFWGYYCQFDFVVLQHLYGDMSQWPQDWPMYCHDLRQWLDDHGLQDVKQPDDAPHDALDDARWIAQTFRRLWAEVEVTR